MFASRPSHQIISKVQCINYRPVIGLQLRIVSEFNDLLYNGEVVKSRTSVYVNTM